MQVLVKKATGFKSKLSLSRGGKHADAKAIFDVMLLLGRERTVQRLRAFAKGREA